MTGKKSTGTQTGTMSTTQVARRLGVSNSTIARWASKGKLRALESEAGKHKHFDIKSVEAFAESNTEVMTTKEVAIFLGISSRQVLNFAHKGEIHAKGAGLGNFKIFDRKEVEEYAAARTQSMTTVEVAKVFGVNPKTIQTWVTKGKLQARVCRLSGKMLFDRKAVETVKANAVTGPNVMSTNRVARYLEVPRDTVLDWVNAGLLPTMKETPGEFRYFCRAEVEAFEKKHL